MALDNLFWLYSKDRIVKMDSRIFDFLVRLRLLQQATAVHKVHIFVRLCFRLLQQAAASCSSRKMSLFSRSQHKSRRSIRFEANLRPKRSNFQDFNAPRTFLSEFGDSLPEYYVGPVLVTWIYFRRSHFIGSLDSESLIVPGEWFGTAFL